MRKKRRPTQADVARLAGVSPAVVSTVLNDNDRGSVRVGPETVERVKNAVMTLGYVPNPVARNLAGGRNDILGVFTFESIFPIKQRNFYYPFLLGIEHAAEEQGFDLLLFTSAGGPGAHRSIYRDGANRLQMTDGAVLLGHERDKRDLQRLHDEGFPFVFVGRRELERAELSWVAADYAGGTADVVTFLAELGHRRMAYVGEPIERESIQDRIRGFRTSLTGLGLRAPHAPVHKLATTDITPERLESWLGSGVTAFLLETDSYARAVLAAADAANLHAPEDFSFGVLGDPLEPSDSPPDWTSFRIPRQEMGRQSLQVLLELLDDPSLAPIQRTLPCTLSPGASTGRVAAGGTPEGAPARYADRRADERAPPEGR